MKRQRQTELPRFVVGALATAGASMANAATVQITFTNNFVANTPNGGASSFTGDLTGDGVIDVGQLFNTGFASILKNGSGRLAGAFDNFGDNLVMTRTGGSASGYGEDVSLSGVVGFRFSDIGINGGAVTNAWLDVTAFSGGGLQRVTLHRLIFDTSSTVRPTGVTHSSGAFTEFSAIPEPSSLGLLALGAGGLLARRRREKAAA